MKDRLRNPKWWASNQGTLAGIAIALGFVTAIFYLLALLIGAALSMSAALGMSHWYWWLGFGMFGLTTTACVDWAPPSRTRRRRQIAPAPRPQLRVIGGGNARVDAEERWGRAA